MFSYFFLAFVFAISWMVLAWVIYLFVKNPAIVDLAWTLCMGALSFFYIFVSKEKLFSLRFILIAMVIWTLRLSLLIGYRLIKYKTDGRYQTLDKSFEKFRKVKYFLFFLMQGVSALVFTLPILLVASFGKGYYLWDIFSACIVFIALLGVIVSDIQLQTFIREKRIKVGFVEWVYGNILDIQIIFSNGCFGWG